MKTKTITIILMILLLSTFIIYFNGCQKADSGKTKMGIFGALFYGNATASTAGQQQYPAKPNYAAISPQKWQQMIATDINTLQTGASTKKNNNAINVVSFHPQGDTTGGSDSDEISISFSEPVAALEKVTKNAPSLIEIQPFLQGEGYWKSSTTYTYKVSEPRKLSTQYNVRFKGFTSFTGKAIPEKKWTFATPIIGIKHSIPNYGATYQVLNQKIMVAFTQEVDPSRIAKYISIQTPNSFPSFTVRYCTKEELKILYDPYESPESDKHCVIITPSGLFPIASNIVVRFLPGFPPLTGNIGLRKELAISFKTFEVFRVYLEKNEFTPDTGIALKFTNPVIEKDITNRISIKPSVGIEKGGDWDTTYFNLSGRFTPGNTYTLTFPADFHDQFGNRLGAPQTFTVKCNDYVPTFYPPSSFFVLEDYLSPDVPVESKNIFSTAVSYKKLEISDLKNLVSANPEFMRSPQIDLETLSTYNWTLPVKKNRGYNLGFDLKNINCNKQGFYFIYFDAAASDYYHGSIFQLTDVALVAKYSPTQIFLIPFNMKTGEIIPNQNFRIENFAKNGGTLGTVKGNADGIAIFQPAENVLKSNNLEECFVFSDPHKAFVWGKKEEMLDMWNFDSEKFRYNYSPLMLYTHVLAFTDKYLYKGGQTVQLKGLIREIFGGTMRIPAIKTINTEVFNSRGISIKKFGIPADKVASTGSFAGSFALPQDAPTGFYRVAFSIMPQNYTGPAIVKSINFSVQEYKPSKFEVSLAFDQQTLISGQPISGTLSARYLFGTPMSDATGVITWTTEHTYFTPENCEAYTFGTYDSDEMQTIEKKEFTLNKEGIYKFGRKSLSPEGKNSVMLTVHGEVLDKDNNRISSNKSIVLHRGEYYIGVKTGSYFFQQGKPGKIQFITVNPKGQPFKDTKINVNISRHEWKSVQQRDASNALRWETVETDIDVLKETVSLPGGSLEKEYKFDTPGFYNIDLTGQDKYNNTITTRGYFYVTGSGYVSWGVNESRVIDLVTDKKQYKEGENIEVLIKSPFQDSTAMVTVEREKVMWSKVVHLKGNASTIQIPVQKDFIPNIYINVIILKERTGVKFNKAGTDIGKPEFYAGYTTVKVDSSSKELKIDITPNQQSYEPGNDVKLDISVKDNKGLPVKSELCISIVDKGVLNLVNYELPNPFDFFWADRQLDVRTVSTFNDILGRKKFGEKGENQGGDGGGSAYGSVVVRKNFKESAYYTAFITTDEKGKAVVTFKLPDNLTTFKAMAVAANLNNQFGKGNKDILVKKNIILKPALPDFLRLNDKFSGGVVVTNNSSEKLKVSVQVAAENLQREKGDSNEKKVSLNPGETQAVMFKFGVSSTATAKLTFKAIGGKYSDGLYEEIPVRVPTFTEAVANFGRVDNVPAKEQIVVPSGTFRELDNVEITLASSAMVGLKRNFDILQEYPYDCLEQQISKVYPLVGAGDFLLTYKLLDMSKADIDKRVNDLLKRMPAYQSNGGFKYYPDSCCTSEYLTCYAVEFILDARLHGYQIDKQMLKNADEYLKKVANLSVDSRYPYSRNIQFLLQSYAVYDLARDNIFMKDTINNLFEVRDRIPFTGLAYLVRALDMKNSLPPHMQPVLAKTILNKMKDQATMTHFENGEDSSWIWVHESNVKTTAHVLDAFLSVYGKFPYAEKIARWLTTTTNQKRFMTTQDHIRMFMAFEKYYQVFEDETPNFISEVLFNGVSKIKENFSNRELTARTKEIKLTEYKPNDKIETVIKKEGTGALYYLLRLKYYPSGNVEAIDRGFGVEKVYKKLSGEVVKDGVFKAGEKYLVEIKVRHNKDHSFVMLDDAVPAGLKVINPNFSTGSSLDLAKTKVDNVWNSYWGDFYRSEIYFDRMQVFADYLRTGEKTWTYLVIATNPGTYTVPNTVVSEMYNPEVFGRNASQVIQVK